MKSILKSFTFWIIILCYVIFFILMEFGYFVFQIDWIKDFRVWFNEYVITFITYILTFLLCFKIKNQIIKEGIAITVALFVTNCVSFRFDSSEFTILEIILITIQLILILSLIVYSIYSGYRKGEKEVLDLRKKLDENYKKAVLQSPPNVKCLVYNCNRLIKKYSKEIAFIEEFSVEFVQKYIEQDKALRRNKTQK